VSTASTTADTGGPLGAPCAPPRPGRPRDPALDDAILDATMAMFAESGYAGVTIEGVATRAGVGKATVYRRYATRAELVIDAVRTRLCLIHDLTDTGDLRADLLALLQPLVDRLRSADGPVLAALMAERIREPELNAEFERSVVGRKREHVRGLITAAIGRGELPPDTDVELLGESPGAIVWHHALNSLPLDDGFAERVIDHVLRRSASVALSRRSEPVSATKAPDRSVGGQ
jgi:AcrR family transcriptional regulator